MKTTVLTVIALLLGTMGLAQGATAPKAAQDDLKARFPQASGARWEREGNHYEAEWKENGREVAVLYDAQGNWLMTERGIPASELPSVVTGKVMQTLPGAEVLEAERQEKPNNAIGYQVEVRHQGKVRELTLDSKGNLLGDEVEDDDDGEDDTDGDGTDQP